MKGLRDLEASKEYYEAKIREYVDGLVEKYAKVGGLCALSDHNEPPYDTDDEYRWHIHEVLEETINKYILSHDDYENDDDYVVAGADFPEPDTSDSKDYSRVVELIRNYSAEAELKFDTALSKVKLALPRQDEIYDLIPYQLKKELSAEQLQSVIEIILPLLPELKTRKKSTKPKSQKKIK